MDREDSVLTYLDREDIVVKKYIFQHHGTLNKYSHNLQGQTTLTGGIGTVGYMPSEQANGKPKLASDIYAVGIIGIQALTGLLPHELPEDPQTGEIIWRNHVRVSNPLADVLDTMVRDHFSRRYDSATSALAALVATQSPPLQNQNLYQPAKPSFFPQKQVTVITPTVRLIPQNKAQSASSITSNQALNYTNNY